MKSNKSKISNFQFEEIINEIERYDLDYSSCYSFWMFEAHNHPHGWVTKEEREKLFKSFVRSLSKCDHVVFPGLKQSDLKKMTTEDKALLLSFFANEEMSNFSESYSGENTGFYFRNPNVVKNIELIRFSEQAPERWRGHEPYNLGITMHETSGDGILVFAFPAKDLSRNDIKYHQSNYGRRMWKIVAKEALLFDHIADGGGRQAVFDMDDEP